MNKAQIKFLTLPGSLLFKFVVSGILFTSQIQLFAAIFTLDTFQTHQRLNFFVPKDKINVRRAQNIIEVSTYDLEAFKQIQEQLGMVTTQSRFFKGVRYSSDKFPEAPAVALIELNGPEIEMFSFYRAPEQKLVVDVWSNTISSGSAESLMTSPVEELSNELIRPTVEKNPAKTSLIKNSAKIVDPKAKEKAAVVSSNEIRKPEPQIEIKELSLEKMQTTKEEDHKTDASKYRDFRYGGSYVWNYPALMIAPGDLIKSKIKTVDYFYPIKDRVTITDEKEAQMQLSINLYRKEKYGLMEKSIKLYEQKYGEDSNAELNEYLRANALQRTYINNGDPNIRKTVLHLYSELLDRTKEFELQKGILKFLMQGALEDQGYIELLRLSKILFVKARADYDTETAGEAAKYVIYSLAQLKQLDKIEKFVQDEVVAKMLPGQSALAAKSYVALNTGKEKDLINEYQKISAGLQRPLDPAYLYNMAEAYFRTAQYEKAIEHYQSFIKSYAHLTQASHSKLRLALSYDFMDRPSNTVIEAYKEAINASTEPGVRYEAKVRYVGLAFDRVVDRKKLDPELLVFMEYTDIEKKAIDQDMSKLVWLVRLRSLIQQELFTEAFTYLKSIPLETLAPENKRVFLGEAGEIIYGMMSQDFKQGNYTRVVKAWELYRSQYIDKVAQDPYTNYMAGISYLKLGLNDSFDRVIKDYQKTYQTQQKTYPLWVERSLNFDGAKLVLEMEIARDYTGKNWSKVIANLKTLTAEKFPKRDYYLGMSYYQKKELADAQAAFESFFLTRPDDLALSDEEATNLAGTYVEVLHELGKWERFAPVTQTFSRDLKIRKGNQTLITKTRERIEYLASEYVASLPLEKSIEIEQTLQDFVKNFPKSSYRGRVQYLLGHQLVKASKYDSAEQVLTKVMGDNEVSSYIRELARAELSDLKLRKRSL